MSFFKGTSIEQDGRFVNKDKKLIEKMEFPPEFDTQVSKTKINLQIIKSWIEKKLNDILGFDDDCLCSYIINLIDECDELIEPKKIQYAITGFLDNKTYEFMQEFWKILISAQKTPDGIPRELIEEKKEEIIKQTKKQKEKLKFLDDIFKKDKENENKPRSRSSSEDRHRHSHSRRHHHHHRHKSRRRSRSRSKESK